MSLSDDYDDEVTAFFRKHAGKVLGYLLNMGTDPGLAEEITDDAFLAARRYWPRVRSLDRPEAYVFKIARNERSKRQRRHDRRAGELRPEPAGSPRLAADMAQGADDRVVIRQALLRLPPRLREVVTLRHVENVSVEATAEILDISQGAVKRYASDGRQMLRGFLADSYSASGKG